MVVYFGVCFNILPKDLEKFYLENNSNRNMIEGLSHQEFRKVVVCGSFQQYLDDIGDVMKTVQKYGTQVLSPWTTKIVPETLGTNFILLEGQEPLKNERDTWKHKREHMEKMRKSDAIIICNPDGTIGQGTMFELGFMIAFSKRIIMTNKPKDLSILFPYEVGVNFY